MTIQSKIVAFGTAAAIGLGALTGAGAAQAAPLAPATIAAQTEAGDTGVIEVGKRKRHRHGFDVYVDYGHRHGRRCRIKRVKVYDPYYDEYFIEKRKICRGRRW